MIDAILPGAARIFRREGLNLRLKVLEGNILEAWTSERCSHDNHDFHRSSCYRVHDQWRVKELGEIIKP